MKQIALGELQVHGHGTIVTDSSMPNAVYTLDAPLLFEIDANTKEVLNKYDIPLVSGLYRMEFSHVNRHIFMRGYVCCSCGFEGSDLGVECGLGSAKFVDVVTGPNQATNVTSKCGHSCEGSPADTLGVLEWDTKSKEIIGYHMNSLGFAADPYIDPRGRYLVMLANDGGREVTIIKTGENGESSKQIAVVETSFSEEDSEKGIWDVCFIEMEDYEIAIFVSTLANFVVLVDMSTLESGKTITTQKIWLTDDQDAEVISNHGRGARRNCAWAFGSPYVWVDAGKTEEVYILELSNEGGKPTAKRIRNAVDTPSRFLTWVSNHREDTLMAKARVDAVGEQEPMPNPISPTTVSSAKSSNDASDGSFSSIAVAALIIGTFSFLMNLFLLLKYNRVKKQNRGNVDGLEKESPLQSDDNA